LRSGVKTRHVHRPSVTVAGSVVTA
jgi:hypothetical protein